MNLSVITRWLMNVVRLLFVVGMMTQLLFPARQAFASVCACYKTNGHCGVDTMSTTVSDSECSLLCDPTSSDPLFSRAAWAEGTASIIEEGQLGYTIYNDCMSSESRADATDLAARATPATSTSYATPKLAVDIPGVNFTPASDYNGEMQVNYIGEYLSGFYKYLANIGIVIATVFIMVGGLQYVMGASTGNIGKAKERITNAVTGFVLLLFVVLILRTVNPVLTIFSAINGLTIVQEVPTDHMIEPSGSDGMDAAETAATGVSDWQDCMVSTFGATKTDVQAKLVDVTFQGKTYKFHELVAPDAQAAFLEIEEAITAGTISSTYKFSSIGVFNWRANRNKPSYMSVHAFGGAIDINPSTNPNCKLGTSCIGKYDMPAAVVSIFGKHGFGWGGNWKSVKDYMHFSTNKYCGGSR